jgi:hypothetical protein
VLWSPGHTKVSPLYHLPGKTRGGLLRQHAGVAPFRETKRLSESDKAALMGGTLQKVYKW